MRLSRLLALIPLPALAVTSVEPAITGATPDVLKAMQGEMPDVFKDFSF